MSSTSLKNIALVGAGGIGTRILRALVATKQANVIVITRAATAKSLPPDLSSVPIIEADYTDVSALTALLKSHNVEIVVSTLSTAPGLKAQYPLADAAKASGTVKLFVPSEWGTASEGTKHRGEDNVFAIKDELAEHLKTIGLPSTRFYTGFFIEYLQWVVGLETNNSVNTLGQGETPFSVTSEEDIGGFVAHVLTSLPSDSPHLQNKSLRMEGERVTIRDLARIYNQPLVLIPEGNEVPAKTAGEAGFKTLIQIEVDGGRASTGWDWLTETDRGDAGTANKLWEGHVWKTVQDIVKAK
ncbi:NAD(P)-binding protein [Gymnopus androsaceus JB14]|uniref:NAD(P)-binding protein n=1 Tax=Gymnopus androsaceus JB14 TaxID=1447944 RepID=A0A6A4I215_9AGAR|nr:NAD(P)-binding protein [Gymnopus androsaceus JB14]